MRGLKFGRVGNVHGRRPSKHLMGSSMNRRQFLRNGAISGAAIMAAPLLAACGESDGAGTSADDGATHVRQGWIRQFAPSAVSEKEVEILKRNRQSAELVAFNRGLDGLVAMENGDIDYTAYLLGYTHLIQAMAENIPVKVLAGSGSGISEVLIRPDLIPDGDYDDVNKAYAGDNAWELMRGRKVGIARGSTQEFITRSYLNFHDMSFETDIEFIDLKSNTDQLIALERGDVEIAVPIVPSATQARVEGYGALLAHPFDAGDFTRLNTALIVRQGFIDEAPESAQAVVDAHVEAVDFYNASAAQWVEDTVKVTLFDQEVIQHLMFPDLLGLEPELWQNVFIDYVIPVEEVQKLAAELFEAGFVEQDVSDQIPDVVDLSLLEQSTGKSASELGAPSG